MFNLECGFVGEKELFVVTKYLENEIQTGFDSKILIEKKHSGRIVGQLFHNFESLLSEASIYELKNLDEYIEYDTDGLDEDDLVDYCPSEEIKDKFDDLKENEILHMIVDCNGSYFGTDKESLILENIADGQDMSCYSSYQDALDDINNKNELVAVFFYNYLDNQTKNNFLEEYNKD